MSIGAVIWRQCDGKIQYETREAAEQRAAAANRPRGKREQQVRVYECSCCGQFHVGMKRHGQKRIRAGGV